MASIQEAIKRLTYMFTSTGAEKVASDLNKVGDAQANVAASAQKTEQASLSLEKSFDNLERKFVSTVRAQQDYAKVQDTVNAAVKQNPELQDRANVVLESARAKFDAAKGSATGFNAILESGRGALLGYAAGIGPIGALLGSFGPLGIAAAAGIGIVSAALDHMKEVSDQIGVASSGIKQFADTTGLTIAQVRGLNDMGGKLGVTSEQMGTAIQKFTFNLADARRGSGDLYNELKGVDRGLAENVANTRDTAQALDLLAKAYNSTADATTKAAIARAAFGKGGSGPAEAVGQIGNAGGVNAYSDAVNKALGVTDQWTKEVARLRNENKSLEEDLKTMEGSFYAKSVLDRQNQFLKTQLEINAAIMKSVNNGSDPNVLMGQQQVADSGGVKFNPENTNSTKELTAATQDLNQAQAALAATTQTGTAAQTADAAAKDTNTNAAIRLANQTNSDVAILGSAATAYEKLQAKLNTLAAWYAQNTDKAEIYNRAVAAAYKDNTEAYKGTNAAATELNKTDQAIVQANAAAAQETQRAAAETARAAAAALEWQQNLLGVSEAGQRAAAAIQAAANADSARLEAEARAASPNAGTFNPDIMPTGQHVFAGGDPNLNAALTQQKTIEAAGIKALADTAYANGGAAAAYAAVINAPNQYGSTGEDFGQYGYDTTQILGPVRSTVSDKISALDSIAAAQNAQTTDKSVQNSNTMSEVNALRQLPQTVEVQKRIGELINAVNGLTTSTNSLNATNQDLLSPYYTMDPRTSHIGFRSQGMAAGGYVDVPGAASSNDNMIATIPVASGERIYVDPMNAKRGGGGQSFAITQNITIQGSASKDQVGRTLYQSGQTLQRQLAAAGH